MKKLLFIAALGVAGFMSAKSNTMGKITPTLENTSVNKSAECLLIHYDCGTNGIACGNNLMEILELAWNGYDFMCGIN
ncbi:MAG TPA: hypothetical protein DD740_00875 [Chryseobacterium sp.]|nr:hypothetical protein [Chryseobacterium sp.]